jgi:hypothetical protein
MMDLTPYAVAFIVSIPGYIAAYLSWRAQQSAKEQAARLELVHALVNSQSEKLNLAIAKASDLEGQIKGRADLVEELNKKEL